MLMATKICPWDGGVCRRDCCDSILSSGRVVVCEFHGNKLGRLTAHKVVPVHVSVFSRSSR